MEQDLQTLDYYDDYEEFMKDYDEEFADDEE